MAIKNRTLAIDAAPAAIPPKPKIAAIIAITRKVIDQRNIILDFVGEIIDVMHLNEHDCICIPEILMPAVNYLLYYIFGEKCGISASEVGLYG